MQEGDTRIRTAKQLGLTQLKRQPARRKTRRQRQERIKSNTASPASSLTIDPPSMRQERAGSAVTTRQNRGAATKSFVDSDPAGSDQ
jgi:hypothetical protein